LLPTPTANDAKNNAGPSQYQRHAEALNVIAGGPLNPEWVEWLMGFPVGWTALERSVTLSFQKSRSSSRVRLSRAKRQNLSSGLF